jgi:hypothetical protein
MSQQLGTFSKLPLSTNISTLGVQHMGPKQKKTTKVVEGFLGLRVAKIPFIA